MAENFDPIFTRAKVELTPPDRNALMILKHLNPGDFAEFDWVNPYYEPIIDPPLIEHLFLVSTTSAPQRSGPNSPRSANSAASTTSLPLTKEFKSALKVYSFDKNKK
ncbi:Camp-dependent protein kinase catalytic subunit [Daphnia magna]|nr:Camp-dependent protein kinase catalytic subunit [Daphnia magna]